MPKAIFGIKIKKVITVKSDNKIKSEP